MPASFYSFRNSEGQEIKPTYDQPAPPFPLKETGEMAYDLGKGLVQNTAGDMIVPAPWRGWQSENEGRKRDAVGSGKGFGEGVSNLVDTGNTISQIAAKNLGEVGRIKPSIAKDFLDPSFLRPFPKIDPKSVAGRVGTNIGIGLVLGAGSDALGQHVGGKLDDVSEQEYQLQIARFAGDDELANKIMDAINSRKTYASDARTMGDAISKGSSAGWWGMLTGGIGGLGVSGLRHAMGGEKHAVGADPAFMREVRRKRAEALENAFSVEGSGWDPSDAFETLSENLRKYGDRESITPEIGSEEDLQLERTIKNAVDYIKRNKGRDEKFDKSAAQFRERFFELRKRQKDPETEQYRALAKQLREQYK